MCEKSNAPHKGSPELVKIDCLVYKLIFNASSNSMAISDFSTGKIVDVNKAWISGVCPEGKFLTSMVVSKLGVGMRWRRQLKARETDFAVNVSIRGH